MANWITKLANSISSEQRINRRIEEAVTAAVQKVEIMHQLSEEHDPLKSIEPQHKEVIKQVYEELKARGLDRYEYQVAAAFSAIYMKVSDTLRKQIRDVDKMSYFYLVDVIITQLAEDALTPQISTGDVFEISSPVPEIQKEIDWLEEKFDLDNLVLSIVPDMIKFGDYTLETKVEKSQNPEQNQTGVVPTESAVNENKGDSGLVGIMDTVEQGTVIAVTKYAQIEGYLVNNGKGKIIKKEPADYVKFSMNSQRIRVDIHKEFGVDIKKLPEELQDIPRFIRVGKSLIYGIISKLKELELLEALVPATKLSKLSSGSMIGVQVPAGFEIEKAMEAAKRIEQLVNRKVGIDPKLGELTIENIMSSAGRIKCIPQFGDKGTLSKIDVKSDEPDQLLNSVTDIRKVICSSVGIPYEIIFGDDGANRGQILKKYARYLRKLKAIQKAVEEGLRQIVYIHLANKGFTFKADDIKVEFFQKLVELDKLDHLEFMDATIGLLKNIKDFLVDLSEQEMFKGRVNQVGLVRFINEQLNVVGFNDILLVPDDVNKDGVPDDLQGGKPLPQNSKDVFRTEEEPSPITPSAYGVQQ